MLGSFRFTHTYRALIIKGEMFAKQVLLGRKQIHPNLPNEVLKHRRDFQSPSHFPKLLGSSLI
jgi:hypothetical protein